MIARSDLYEKPGKSPHAFCTDIDREGDVRVLANIVPNEYWMGTMLHELGHSVYSQQEHPRSVPYVLRTEAHILTTEGIAMMFERFSKDADWLLAMGVAVPDPDGVRRGRLDACCGDQLLIFSRWCQVMFRFEKALYDNPDQDLNTLWWDLVEKYQMVHRPEGRNAPDYASKIHIVSAPGLLSQLHDGPVVRRPGPPRDRPRRARRSRSGQGELRRQARPSAIFSRRRSSRPADADWNGLTRHATGEDLNPEGLRGRLPGVSLPPGRSRD